MRNFYWMDVVLPWGMSRYAAGWLKTAQSMKLLVGAANLLMAEILGGDF
jgi:hypothetical protein